MVGAFGFGQGSFAQGPLAAGAVPLQVMDVEHVTLRQPQVTLLDGASALVRRLTVRTPHVRQDQEA